MQDILHLWAKEKNNVFGLELEGLQIYWWLILSLLGGLLVFMFFVQGGQTLIDELSKDELEKTMLVNSL
ncbi:hypothetical protein OLS58_09905, partial [Campylobacter jejuni]|nr:hypothetical protein [Campylobacter jejuni]